MKIKGFDEKELTFAGFWDSTMFKHNKDSGGVIFKLPEGGKLFVTHKELQKARKNK